MLFCRRGIALGWDVSIGDDLGGEGTYGEGCSEVVGVVCPVSWYYWVEGELERETVWERLEGV